MTTTFQYNCHLCTAKFKTKHQLKSHQTFMHNIRMQWHFCKVCADSFDLLLDGANKAVPCVQLQVLLQVVESHRDARAIFLEFDGCPPALVAVNEERLLNMSWSDSKSTADSRALRQNKLRSGTIVHAGRDRPTPRRQP